MDNQTTADVTINNTTTPETPAATATPEADFQSKLEAAVAKATAKIEAELKKREADARRKAELSKLSDDERQKAELESTRRELETQRTEFEREKLKFDTTKIIAQRGLPVEFTEYLLGTDPASTLDRVKTFEKAYKAAVEAAVNEKLKSRAPIASTATTKPAPAAFLDAILANQAKRF